MATKTFDELKQLAIQIRDEKTNKQNTANRVGTAMLEGINKLEQDYYDKIATDEELKERDEKLTELEPAKKVFPLKEITSDNDVVDIISSIQELYIEGEKIDGLQITDLRKKNETNSTSQLKLGYYQSDELINLVFINEAITGLKYYKVSKDDNVFHVLIDWDKINTKGGWYSLKGVKYELSGKCYQLESNTYIQSKILKEQTEKSISNLKANKDYYTCSVGASDPNKVVSSENYVLESGNRILIKMTNANSANSVTLNINNTGAKNLFYNGTQAGAYNSWKASEILDVYYDGEKYVSERFGGVNLAAKISYEQSKSVLGIDNIQGMLDAVGAKSKSFPFESFSVGSPAQIDMISAIQELYIDSEYIDNLYITDFRKKTASISSSQIKIAQKNGESYDNVLVYNSSKEGVEYAELNLSGNLSGKKLYLLIDWSKIKSTGGWYSQKGEQYKLSDNCFNLFFNHYIGNKLFTNTEDNEDISDKLNIPQNIYIFGRDSQAINYIIPLTAEGILTEKKDISINGGKQYYLNQVNPISSNFDKQINVEISGNGIKKVSKSITLKQTPISNLKNKDYKLMMIGSSTTALGFAVHLAKIAGRFNKDVDGINIQTIGTIQTSYTDTYKNEETKYTANHEGRSGWALADMLRHAVSLRLFYGSNSDSLIFGKAAYDSLGLGYRKKNGTPSDSDGYIAYNQNDKEQRVKVAQTCHGYYDADPSEELWNWCKTYYPTFNYQDNDYTFGETYSSADDDKQIKCIKYICENPKNTWFNIEKVNSTNGDYVLDFARQITRAGSVNPTHVTIITAGNDINIYNDVSLIDNVISDFNKLIGIIKENISCKIAVGMYRSFGAFYPAKWSEYGLVKELTISSGYWNFEVNKKLLSLDNPSENIYYIPTYTSQYVIGSPNDKTSEVYGESVICDNDDSLHAIGDGWDGNAVEPLAWMAYVGL